LTRTASPMKLFSCVVLPRHLKKKNDTAFEYQLKSFILKLDKLLIFFFSWVSFSLI